jgi:hypothetical protein
VALNRLWALLSAWGTTRSVGGAVPVLVGDWWDWLDGALDFGPVAARLGISDPGIRSRSPLADLAEWAGAAAGTGEGIGGTWPPNRAVTEDRLAAWPASPPDDPGLAAATVALLVLVRERVGRPAQLAQAGEDIDILAVGGTERLAMTRFFDRARRAVMTGATVGEFTRSLVLDYVIRQHERVAMSKLPDDTFRFRRDGTGCGSSHCAPRPDSTTPASPRSRPPSRSWAWPAVCSQPTTRSLLRVLACSRRGSCPSGR